MSSAINKVLVAAIVVLIGMNIKLYLQSVQSASNVSLSFTENGIRGDFNAKFIKDAGMNRLTAQLNSLTKKESIHSLDLELSMCSLTDASFLPFLQALPAFEQLQTLSLSLGHNTFSNSTATSLADSISQLKSLKSLTLELDSLFDKEGRQYLFSKLQGLQGLRHLSVQFIHTDLSGKQLEAFLPIADIHTLKSLELVLVGCKIKQEEASYLKELLLKAPKLEELTLNLYANKLLADGAAQLAQGVYAQRYARKFALELFFNNITVNGTESLTGALSHMVNVTHFKLGLEFNYIEDQGGVMVANLLEKLTLIQDLELNLATKNFGWVGYQAAIQVLHKLNHLQNLNLIIGVNKCGARGAEELKHLLVRHNKLKTLKFNFLENYVGDQGAIHIAEGIKALKNVEELHVNMNFNSLTDFGALEIAKAVQEAKSPNRIDLRLSQNEIQDASALEIFQIIDKVVGRSNVQKFEFEFLNTALTNSTRDVILEKFDNKEKLEIRLNTIPPSNWDKEEEQ